MLRRSQGLSKRHPGSLSTPSRRKRRSEPQTTPPPPPRPPCRRAPAPVTLLLIERGSPRPGGATGHAPGAKPRRKRPETARSSSKQPASSRVWSKTARSVIINHVLSTSGKPDGQESDFWCVPLSAVCSEPHVTCTRDTGHRTCTCTCIYIKFNTRDVEKPHLRALMSGGVLGYRSL